MPILLELRRMMTLKSPICPLPNFKSVEAPALPLLSAQALTPDLQYAPCSYAEPQLPPWSSSRPAEETPFSKESLQPNVLILRNSTTRDSLPIRQHKDCRSAWADVGIKPQVENSMSTMRCEKQFLPLISWLLLLQSLSQDLYLPLQIANATISLFIVKSGNSTRTHGQKHFSKSLKCTCCSFDSNSASSSALEWRSSINPLTFAVNSSFNQALCCSNSSFSWAKPGNEKWNSLVRSPSRE